MKTFRPALIAPSLIALAFSAAGYGVAHAASHDRDTFIKEQDLDGDGKVSKEEFAKGRAAEFARMDKNHDGKLSHDEYIDDYEGRLEVQLKALPPEKREAERGRELGQAEVRFGVLDSDKNGFISVPEWDYSGWRMFTHHDTNKDGFVSKDDPKSQEPA